MLGRRERQHLPRRDMLGGRAARQVAAGEGHPVFGRRERRQLSRRDMLASRGGRQVRPRDLLRGRDVLGRRTRGCDTLGRHGGRRTRGCNMLAGTAGAAWLP